jgi:hypothetical protein
MPQMLRHGVTGHGETQAGFFVSIWGRLLVQGLWGYFSVHLKLVIDFMRALHIMFKTSMHTFCRKPMIIGYVLSEKGSSKSSTDSNGATIFANSSDIIFYDKEKPSLDENTSLSQALGLLKEGDTLTIKNVSAIVPSMHAFLCVKEILEKKKAYLYVENIDTDTRTSAGKFIINIMAAMHQYEADAGRENN